VSAAWVVLSALMVAGGVADRDAFELVLGLLLFAGEYARSFDSAPPQA
jgi:hypothetical protein